jgi:L-threonylcarbamoyladenylate synthase
VGADEAIERAVTALRDGRPVLLPTDTVYGLCAAADGEAPTRAVYRLKGRPDAQPSQLIAPSLDALYGALPELRTEAGDVVRALLPGPYTLVLPNPARRFRWLNGTRTDTVGVRVPNLPDVTRRILEAVGVVVATSANEPGDASPASLDEVPARIRAGCGAEVDVGPLPGTPSTVLDLTGAEPYVIREGAVPAVEALDRARSARARQ